MRFEWDDFKNEINIRKHGIDFTDVQSMFSHPMLALFGDTRAPIDLKSTNQNFTKT